MKQGKKLTAEQRKFLTNAGIPDPMNWLYNATESQTDGQKRAAKNSGSSRVMVVSNRLTNEVRRIDIV